MLNSSGSTSWLGLELRIKSWKVLKMLAGSQSHSKNLSCWYQPRSGGKCGYVDPVWTPSSRVAPWVSPGFCRVGRILEKWHLCVGIRRGFGFDKTSTKIFNLALDFIMVSPIPRQRFLDVCLVRGINYPGAGTSLLLVLSLQKKSPWHLIKRNISPYETVTWLLGWYFLAWYKLPKNKSFLQLLSNFIWFLIQAWFYTFFLKYLHNSLYNSLAVL